ncbi:MAG: hypothetical protein ACHP6H_05920, partial [Legionellales bacterium]
PIIQGYVAVSTNYTTVYSNTRLDSIYYNPFVVPLSVSSFYVAVLVTDDSTPINQLQVNQLKISTKSDDFSGATVLPAVYLAAGGQQYWVATVNTSSFNANDTLYMRYDVNDGGHPSNTEFPRNDLPYPYKTYWSFTRR